MEVIELIPCKNRINGILPIGGSKSYTNRALIMAALAKGKSILTSLSMSDDSAVLIQALQKLGVQISLINKTTIEINGNGGNFENRAVSLDVGHAGTSMRFLTALSSLVPGTIIIDGSIRMRERPIHDLVVALRHLGAKINCLNKEGFPPLLINGGSLNKSSVQISGKVSSQFITALLLIAPVLKDGLEIHIQDMQISKSYVDMTMSSMKSFGASVLNDSYRKYTVKPGSSYIPAHYQIEGDASGASYLFAIAAVTGGKITVTNINVDSAQGDVHFVDILEKMGCEIKKDQMKKSITVIGPKKLKALSVDMSLMPDTAQTLAVLAAFADGVTHIKGLSTLKVKETDRLEATKSELRKMGITSVITDDSITVIGGNPKGARIRTYDDHRMALAFSVAGAVIPGMQIENPIVVAKSFPDYWEKIQSLGIVSKKI
jgi:3-phosphoshikimate 1-carboxyvinyltransferase